jgi:F0F1-type ATP synthase assembly protein I
MDLCGVIDKNMASGIVIGILIGWFIWGREE